MDVSLTFIRILFLALSVLLSTSYLALSSQDGPTIATVLLGIISGGAFGTALIGVDTLLRRFNLRTFNIAVLGVFFGYLLGLAILSILTTIIDFGTAKSDPMLALFIKTAIFLTTIYIGMIMTARAAEELYISLPFVKFKSTTLKKKDIIIDSSVFNDARIIDLASSGLH